MKETTTNKKNHVILVVLSILVVILIAAVYLKGRQFNKFIEGLGEESQTEVKTGNGSQEKSVPRDDEDTYQKKITRKEN